MADSKRIRNDGKPARKPRLGVPASSLVPTKRGPVDEKSPSWHELVQPGAKGDPAKAQTRAELVRHGQTVEPSSVDHGKQQHGVPVRAWPMHGLVLHRLRARSGGGIDREGTRQARHDARVASGQHSTRRTRRESKAQAAA